MEETPQATPIIRNEARTKRDFAAFLILALIAFWAVVVLSSSPAKVLKPSQQAAAAVPDPFTDVHLIAKSAIVIDMVSGKTLYALNPDAQLPLASLTKVAMALAVSEVLRPEEEITIPYDTAPSGSAMRLAKGTRWSVRQVMDFTLVASSNDGADILADAADTAMHEKYPESPENHATLWRMNELARELGLEHTYFLNANGLDFSSTQSGAYGSARDMAKLFAYAVSSGSELFAGTRRDGLSLASSDGSGKTAAFNTNSAQGYIPGLIMGKTGYTELAGGNLAIVFDIGLAHPVVAVVLGSTHEGRFTDMQMLITHAQEAIGSGYAGVQ